MARWRMVCLLNRNNNQLNSTIMRFSTFQSIIDSLKNDGVIFGAEYRKKDGSITKINGRFGVHKFAKGTGKSSPKVLTVWDNNRKRYTSLIPENIISLNAYGSHFRKIPSVVLDGES